MSEGMILLFFLILCIVMLPTILAVMAALKEADPLDERQALIRGKAYRDVVILLLVCYSLSAMWFGLRKDAGLPAVAKQEAAVFLITLTGLSFYMADCIVRGIAYGTEGDRKTTLRSMAGSYGVMVIMGLSTVWNLVRTGDGILPVGIWPGALFLGFTIFGATQLLAIVIRMLMDKKEPPEEA